MTMEQCEVCGRDRMTWVHCSSLGPFSIASCRECLAHIAEPEFAFRVMLRGTVLMFGAFSRFRRLRDRAPAGLAANALQSGLGR